MANAGPNTNGSQFFVVYGDSALRPNYTVFGKVGPAGLAILDKVAAGGIEPTAEETGTGRRHTRTADRAASRPAVLSVLTHRDVAGVHDDIPGGARGSACGDTRRLSESPGSSMESE
ncbi:peptidylprolyl isomerase [Streptomyces zaomyceticus]|uniref:peptidylprolyl isomerase n=1 Tax=Streptomyces zaomyceticus TaxID=68286 RepID=UPI00343B621A